MTRPHEIRDDNGRFLCGDLNIHNDREGTWFYLGTPIGRKELVKLFSTVIHRDRDGAYWLITPAAKGVVEISCHCSCLESIVEPRFDLAIDVGFPVISVSF